MKPTRPVAPAVISGAEFFQKEGERLAAAAVASGDQIVFYAAFLGGFFGHMSAALGGETADALVAAMRPFLVQTVRDIEQRRSH